MFLIRFCEPGMTNMKCSSAKIWIAGAWKSKRFAFLVGCGGREGGWISIVRPLVCNALSYWGRICIITLHAGQPRQEERVKNWIFWRVKFPFWTWPESFKPKVLMISKISWFLIWESHHKRKGIWQLEIKGLHNLHKSQEEKSLCIMIARPPKVSIFPHSGLRPPLMEALMTLVTMTSGLQSWWH